MKIILKPTRETKNYIVFQTEGYDDWAFPGVHVRAHLPRTEIEGTPGPIEITIAPILVVDEPEEPVEDRQFEVGIKDDIPW